MRARPQLGSGVQLPRMSMSGTTFSRRSCVPPHPSSPPREILSVGWSRPLVSWRRARRPPRRRRHSTSATSPSTPSFHPVPSTTRGRFRAKLTCRAVTAITAAARSNLFGIFRASSAPALATNAHASADGIRGLVKSNAGTTTAAAAATTISGKTSVPIDAAAACAAAGGFRSLHKSRRLSFVVGRGGTVLVPVSSS